jgi:hypothetical protein
VGPFRTTESCGGPDIVGLTLFAELAAAIACAGFALSLAELAGVRNRVTIFAVGSATGFFIGFVTQLGVPLIALPIAVIAASGLDRWIDQQSQSPARVGDLATAAHHPLR